MKARFQKDTVVTIKGGKKAGSDKYDTYKFWEIVGEMTWRGADRFQAEDAAKWCGRAEPGSEKTVSITEGPDISVKVRRNTKPER